MSHALQRERGPKTSHSFCAHVSVDVCAGDGVCHHDGRSHGEQPRTRSTGIHDKTARPTQHFNHFQPPTTKQKYPPMHPSDQLISGSTHTITFALSSTRRSIPSVRFSLFLPQPASDAPFHWLVCDESSGGAGGCAGGVWAVGAAAGHGGAVGTRAGHTHPTQHRQGYGHTQLSLIYMCLYMWIGDWAVEPTFFHVSNAQPRFLTLCLLCFIILKMMQRGMARSVASCWTGSPTSCSSASTQAPASKACRYDPSHNHLRTIFTDLLPFHKLVAPPGSQSGLPFHISCTDLPFSHPLPASIRCRSSVCWRAGCVARPPRLASCSSAPATSSSSTCSPRHDTSSQRPSVRPESPSIHQKYWPFTLYKDTSALDAFPLHRSPSLVASTSFLSPFSADGSPTRARPGSLSGAADFNSAGGPLNADPSATLVHARSLAALVLGLCLQYWGPEPDAESGWGQREVLGIIENRVGLTPFTATLERLDKMLRPGYVCPHHSQAETDQ